MKKILKKFRKILIICLIIFYYFTSIGNVVNAKVNNVSSDFSSFNVSTYISYEDSAPVDRNAIVNRRLSFFIETMPIVILIVIIVKIISKIKIIVRKIKVLKELKIKVNDINTNERMLKIKKEIVKLMKDILAIIVFVMIFSYIYILVYDIIFLSCHCGNISAVEN